MMHTSVTYVTTRQKILVPGARFEHATFGQGRLALTCSPDYESGALARLGYPGTADYHSLSVAENI